MEIQQRYVDTPEVYKDALAAPSITAQQLMDEDSTVLKDFLSSIKATHSPEVVADIKQIVSLLVDGFKLTAESRLKELTPVPTA